MEIESIGKLLPRLLLPHAQDWAQRAGNTFLSKLLVDDQFRLLIERFGGELESRVTERTLTGKRRRGRKSASSKPAESEPQDHDLKAMQERLSALEEQCELQQTIFDTVRKKIRQTMRC